MPKQIKDFNELKHLAGSTMGGLHCFIALNFNCKSSKVIRFDGRTSYYVENYIDGTEDIFTKKQLLESNVGKALKKGALYQD